MVRSPHSKCSEGLLTRKMGERPVREAILLRDKPEPRAFVGDSGLRAAFVGKSPSSYTPPSLAETLPIDTFGTLVDS